MSDVVISVENLSKHYRLGEIGGGTLQEDFARWWAGVRGRPDPLTKVDGSGAAATGDLWALRDVSFEVRQGDVLGVIGRNGAGKSTLLKILSRTTAPTTGRVRVKGRIASLLEVGTGFHPELTGRENIFLNGAILGMKRLEIARKLDEIIDFSGVERFIDTPVKRYSSGMYVRLAFAVAAHLEPEILIVDEVLAVGDAEFQRKCIRKMHDLSSEGGRTVLFVSHNLTAVSNLCGHGLVLDHGCVKKAGNIAEAIDAYMVSGHSHQDNTLSVLDVPRSGGDQKAIQEAWVENGSGEVVQEVQMGATISICFKFKANRTLKQPRYGFGLNDVMGRRVFSLSSNVMKAHSYQDLGEGVVTCLIPKSILLPGQYSISMALGECGDVSVDYMEHAITLEVVARDVFGTGQMFSSSHGCVFVDGDITVAPN